MRANFDKSLNCLHVIYNAQGYSDFYITLYYVKKKPTSINKKSSTSNVHAKDKNEEKKSTNQKHP